MYWLILWLNKIIFYVNIRIFLKVMIVEIEICLWVLKCFWGEFFLKKCKSINKKELIW